VKYIAAAILLVVLTACAAPYVRSERAYPFERPVDQVEIADPDWNTCDLQADRTIHEAGNAYYGDPLNPVTAVIAVLVATAASTDAYYERLMRRCLHARGYAVQLPPEPPGFTTGCDERAKNLGKC
jgi:hypothetical protein